LMVFDGFNGVSWFLMFFEVPKKTQNMSQIDPLLTLATPCWQRHCTKEFASKHTSSSGGRNLGDAENMFKICWKWGLRHTKYPLVN
jgi:hypothetical protein